MTHDAAAHDRLAYAQDRRNRWLDKKAAADDVIAVLLPLAEQGNETAILAISQARHDRDAAILHAQGWTDLLV